MPHDVTFSVVLKENYINPLLERMKAILMGREFANLFSEVVEYHCMRGDYSSANSALLAEHDREENG